MRWDRHTLMAFAGIAALVIGGAQLHEDARAAFAPVLGMVAGIAAMARASHEGLRQKIETLEQRVAKAEWRGGINRAG